MDHLDLKALRFIKPGHVGFAALCIHLSGPEEGMFEMQHKTTTVVRRLTAANLLDICSGGYSLNDAGRKVLEESKP